MFEYFGY